MITVSGLYIAPVKSGRMTSLDIAFIGKTGFNYDRLWMAVDAATGMFVAQRSDRGLGIGITSMCLLAPMVVFPFFTLNAPNMPALKLPMAGLPGPEMEVQVWKDHVIAIDQGEEAAEWITQYLSRERPGKYRLVRKAEDGVRAAKHGDAQVAFQDADSFLIISQESLDDLNSRLTDELPMDRFRPNIVISGCLPYEEDHMTRIRIDGVIFTGTTLCVRCPITTTNQLTAVRGKEPLRTLATYRHFERGVVFGKNFLHSSEGMLSVGDEVKVLERD